MASAKLPTAADMLAQLEGTRRIKLEPYLEADPARAQVFWEFFDGAYTARIPLSIAIEQWVANYGPIPISDVRLGEVLRGRAKQKRA